MSSRAPPMIVHVVHSFAVGGLENGVVNLLNHLSVEHWRHAVLALTTVSPAFAARLHRTVELIELRKPPGHLTRLYPRLYRLFRSLDPAIVHTRNLAALESQVPAMAAGVPGRIHGEHGWDASDPAGMRVRYRVVRRLYRPFVRHYVALSKHLESYLIEHVGVTRSRVSQIYNGVDIVRFRPVSSSVRAPIPGCPFIEPGLWLLGTVGRLDPVKDQVSLARTFVRIVGSDEIARARMRLVIVGEGKVRADIEHVLSEAGVRDLAWLAGERNDIPEVLAGLDCFVLPSLGEGISNTILEAMSTRLPVVATRVGGNEELVDHESTGTLVEPRDGDGLARAILRYFRDPALARKHALGARRRVEQSFSLENMVADYDRLYCSMLAGRNATTFPVGRPDTTLR